MALIDLEVLLKHPLISSVDSKRHRYSGYLTVNHKDYKIDVHRQDDRFILQPTPELSPFVNEINAQTQKNGSITLAKYLNVVASVVSAHNPPQTTNVPTDVYRTVLTEYKDFCDGFDAHKTSIAGDLSAITVSVSDDGHRVHTAVIEVKSDDDKVVYVLRDGLPESESPCNEFESLRVGFLKFREKVRSLQVFFDAMDKFDGNFHVLDPQKPERGDAFRRIALGNNCSLVLTLEPYKMGNIPDLRFLGPEPRIEGFRNQTAQNMHEWDPNGDVVAEFLKLLGNPELPSKPTETSAFEDVLYHSDDCCICFSSRLNEKLPEIVCGNDSCRVYFHTECLYQWLLGLNCRKRFNEIHGKCPNCDKPISCPC